MQRFSRISGVFAHFALALGVMGGGCGVDEGRPLAEYQADYDQLKNGVIPAQWKSVTLPDASGKDSGGAGTTDAGAAGGKDGGVADTATLAKDSGNGGGTQPDAGLDSGAVDAESVDVGPVDAGPPPKDGCSGPDGAKYNIKITNTTTDRNLTIGWNDINCKEIILGQIKPGKSANLGTRLNRWVIIKIDPNNDVIRSFRVTKTTSPQMNVP